jgi:hypothetical protein
MEKRWITPPDRFRGQISLLSNRHEKLFCGMLPTHVHLISRFILHGAISPFPQMYIVWHLIKHEATLWLIADISNVYFIFLLMARQPLGGLGRLIFRGFTITQFTHTTLGRTPLDEWSARRRDLYLTSHNTHNRQTSMPSAGFEPAIPVSERLPWTSFCSRKGLLEL